MTCDFKEILDIWKGILHTYNHDLFLSKNTTYTQGFYFIVLRFFVYKCVVQSSGSLPCEGSFAHTCTNTFVKECHNCCLKWVLKGFLSQGALHPLFSRHVLLFLMKYKSGATRLHFFQNTEYCIHSGTFFDTQTFSKYYCFY